MLRQLWRLKTLFPLRRRSSNMSIDEKFMGSLLRGCSRSTLQRAALASSRCFTVGIHFVRFLRCNSFLFFFFRVAPYIVCIFESGLYIERSKRECIDTV